MTFSIAAYEPATGQFAAGAVTAMPAVGKLVTYAQAGVGAACTQAIVNPYLALDGLKRLAQGSSASEALAPLVDQDPGKDFRQCGIVDRAGGSWAWTGAQTLAWSGHLTRPNVSVQGNRLVGPETVSAVLEAFEDHRGQALARRVLEALAAGEATGADTKGALSANLTVFDTEAYPLWDVRVDHADDPVARLRELTDEFESELLPHVVKLPTRADPMGDAAREQAGWAA